jgi:UDP-glucose 4-epimerase
VRVLVTGGAGYIGAVTAEALLQAGHEVVVLDDLSRGHRDLVPEEAAFVAGRVDDPAAVNAALARGCDGCLHFAALIEAGESMRAPERFFGGNTAATLRLLERLVAAGVGRFVLSSTAAVYGEPDTVPIDESARLEPTNAYGESKLLVERALWWVARQRALGAAALRYFNAAGATVARGEDHHPETHLVPQVLAAAAGNRGAVRVFGDDYATRDGTCVRDFVHVADLAAAHVRALERAEPGRTLVCNLGTGEGASVREVIEAAERVTGRAVPTVAAPRRAGDPAALVADGERARQLLGWAPQRSGLDEIIVSAWSWHRRRWGLEAPAGAGEPRARARGAEPHAPDVERGA